MVNYEFKNFKYNVIEDSQLNLDANMICGFDKIDPYKTNFNNSYFKCLDIFSIYSVDVIYYLILQHLTLLILQILINIHLGYYDTVLFKFFSKYNLLDTKMIKQISTYSDIID